MEGYLIPLTHEGSTISVNLVAWDKKDVACTNGEARSCKTVNKAPLSR
jgi:hypothetical protein